MKFFLLLILFMTSAMAQIQAEKTVSEFIASDSLDKAKPVLLHKAVMEVIKQYSSEFNIDLSIFNKKLNEKFEAYFFELKNKKLSEKFGKNYSQEMTEEQKTTFLNGLEETKSQEFITFAKFHELLDQFAFKDISKDSSDALRWNSTIVLNLNRGKLDRYYKRTISDEKKEFSKIYLIGEINPIGFAWNELGVNDESSFQTPILNSWNKWIQSNLPDNTGDITPCFGTCIDSFNNWLQIPQEEGMQIPLELSNTLWMKVSMNLQKISFEQEVNEWKFEWEGSVVLLDANTKRVIASFNVPGESRSWRGLDQKALNSALASSLYRSPLDLFNKGMRKLSDISRLNRLGRLVIHGHKHLGDVTTLMEHLKKNGQALQLDLALDMFSGNEAQLLCFYQGEEKSFTDLLSSVKELKSSHNYSVVNDFTGVNHVLKLVTE